MGEFHFLSAQTRSLPVPVLIAPRALVVHSLPDKMFSKDYLAELCGEMKVIFESWRPRQ